MRKQKVRSLSVFSLPLDKLEGLSPDEFRQAARSAGVTEEKLKELLAKAREGKARDITAKQEAKEEELKLFRIPSYLRPLIQGMKATPARLEEADRLETEAYRLLEETGGESSSAWAKFLESQMILTQDRLYRLCTEYELRDALAYLHREKGQEFLRRSNVPLYASAIQASRSAVLNSLETSKYRPIRESPDVFGPGEVYSAVLPLNFPRHLRPRRSNDELEPF